MRCFGRACAVVGLLMLLGSSASAWAMGNPGRRSAC
jgi:hypothetical protein